MRVLIVDDDAIVVQSLATILSAEDGIDVVGTCLSGAEAVQEFRRLRPDVLLMDIRMPGADGLSAAEEILEGDPQTRIVFLTTFSDDEYIVRALRMGARMPMEAPRSSTSPSRTHTPTMTERSAGAIWATSCLMR